jgi:hypothetical protein
VTVLDQLARDLRAGGVVGVDAQAKAIFLCLVSRKLKKPQSFIAYGPSAAGKSFLIDTMLALIPPEDIERFDSASDTALFYKEDSLSHRVVYVPETANLTDEVQGFLRVLVSEGQLSRDYTLVEGSKRSVKHVQRDGPCLVAQSSVDAIHPENETRALLIEVPDSPEQTRLVMRSIAAQFAGIITAIDPTAWLALDRMLPTATDIVIDRDLGKALSMLIPATSVRMRRDFRAILTLVCAHALLHLADRPVSTAGATVAGIDDYEVVREILEPIIGVQTDRAVHPEVREFVDWVVSMSRAKGPEGTVTAKEIGDKIGIDKKAAWRRARRALRSEFLVNRETRKNQPAQLSEGSSMPDGIALPTVQDVREWIAATLGGSSGSTTGSTTGGTHSRTGSSGSTTSRDRGVSGTGEPAAPRPAEPAEPVEPTHEPVEPLVEPDMEPPVSRVDPGATFNVACSDYRAHQSDHVFRGGIFICLQCSGGTAPTAAA